MPARIPQVTGHPAPIGEKCSSCATEYQFVATAGRREDPTGDEKFFSLSRQGKVHRDCRHAKPQPLKSALPGENLAHLLQTFRTKPVFALSDDFLSAKVASDLWRAERLCRHTNWRKVGRMRALFPGRRPRNRAHRYLKSYLQRDAVFESKVRRTSERPGAIAVTTASEALARPCTI